MTAAGELPAAVRGRVVALAADTLAALTDDEVPAALRAVRRFTPSKRARLGAAALGAALDTEPGFRRAVAQRVREGLPTVAAAVEQGVEAAAVDPADLAAAAYLLEVPDWRTRVEAAKAAIEVAAPDPAAEPGAEPEAQAKAHQERELRRLRRELTAARHEADELRRRLTRIENTARRAEQARDDALRRVSEVEDVHESMQRRLEAQVRRLRQQLQEAEHAAIAARRAERGDRDAGSARLRVLLETITNASAGLRRELDLPVAPMRPADLAAGAVPVAEPGRGEGLLAALRRGRAADAPALVDELLAVPGLHLVVDGYNVTKLGYANLTLEEQRGRLVNALGGLAARAVGVELTCVFDAAAALHRPVPGYTPRGVRVLFSAVDELADELIVRLVGAEPAGRPVVVVTNDREVVAAVHRAGADTLASAALIARLERL